MIFEYQRPDTIEDALALIQRRHPLTLPLGGGTVLARLSREQSFAVADLQNLKLGKIATDGGSIQIGATVTLETMRLNPQMPHVLAEAIRKDVSANLRHQASIAGTICSAKGNSRLLAGLLSIGAVVHFAGTKEAEPLEAFLKRPAESAGFLITQIQMPLKVRIATEEVVKTPEDCPVLVLTMGKTTDGKCRLCLGGQDWTPIVVETLNQPGQQARFNETEVIKIACSQLSNIFSTDYLSQTIPLLLARLSKSIGAESL